MHELVRKPKETTCKSKLSIFVPDTPAMNLSKTLPVDLTSNEKGLMPYWTPLCQDMSQKLLLLTETGFAGSDLNLCNPLQVKTIAGSWFSTKADSHLKKNLSETCFPSSMFSPVVFTDSVNTVVRSKKIRICPKNRPQIRKYAGISRYWYNQAVEYLKGEGTKTSLAEVRKIQSNEHPDWAMDTPQRIREHAISDACEAVKNAKRKFMETKVFQQVSFRTKRDTVQGFGFDAKSLKEEIIFSSKLQRIGFYATEPIQASLEGTRVVIEDDRYFVIVPSRKPVKTPETQRCDYVALDPGVRAFITFYSEVSHGKIGCGDFKNIFRLCYALDQLQSRISKARCKQKRNMRKASGRLRWKIYDMIDELHKKTAHFLVTRYSTVFIPTFETSQMVTKLRSKTARSMLTFAHHRFKSFLNAKGEAYSCNIIEVSEAYTSKTCSYCGTIHKIGSKKVMKCCADVDRDYNGARGIYLSSLVGFHPATIVGNC